MSFDLSIHHRRSIRFKDYDYSQAGAYFITLCTQSRECNLGEIKYGMMSLSPVGECVQVQWHDLSRRYPHISLDAFVIMPNHLHGILMIHSASPPTAQNMSNEPTTQPVGALLAAPLSTARNTSNQPTPQHAASSRGAASSTPTVGSILRAFKSLSAIAANRLLNRTGQAFWQRNYWERIIRDEQEWQGLREYIHHNPQQWEQDKLYVEMGTRI